jgi:hypothetical protein
MKRMRVMLLGMMMVAVMIIGAGCEDIFSESESGSAGSSASASFSGSSGDAIDISKVVWLHPDVSGWEVTRTLNGVSFGGGLIHYSFGEPDPWPNVGGVNGNPWVFINIDGVWHGVTHEYMRRGYTTRGMNTVAPDHFDSGVLHNYHPKSGTEYGFMVSGLARGSARNVSERSNIVMATWP